MGDPATVHLIDKITVVIENAIGTGRAEADVVQAVDATLAAVAAAVRAKAKAMEDMSGDMTVAADMLDDWADEIAHKPEPDCY